MRGWRVVLLGVGLAVLSVTGGWAAVQFDGQVWVSFQNYSREVTLNVGGIANRDPERRTGSLSIRVWAMSRPYRAGGEIGGYPLAEYSLKPLNGGAYYPAFSRTLAATPPPNGWYYICVVLRQYEQDGWIVESAVGLPRAVQLGPPPRFLYSGFTWQTHPAHSVMDLQVGNISHTTNGTGSLKLTVFATSRPYRAGETGRTIGELNLSPLRAGYAYTGLSRRIGYWAPPPGWYFVNLLISEFDGSTYRAQGVIPATEATLFK